MFKGRLFNSAGYYRCMAFYPRWTSTFFDSSTIPDTGPGFFSKKTDTLLCTILHIQGKTLSTPIRTVPFSKAALCSMHGLPHRDLRKLDNAFKNQIPVILVRQKALLINLDYIKALITHDSVYLFQNTQGYQFQTFEKEGVTEQAKINNFIKELEEKLKAFTSSKPSSAFGKETLPFEFFILETILHRICSTMVESLEHLVPKIESSLSSLESFVHWDKLRILMSCKRSINSVQRQVDGLKRAISDLLDNDQDMVDMYLSRPKNSPQAKDHEEIELLLETYLKMMEEVSDRMQELSRNIEATEDLINTGLVGQRNELLLLQLKINIIALSAGLSAMVASWFGMNLFSGYESHPSAFYITTITCILAALVTGHRCWKQMSRIVRKI
jgi:magnesium transporter